VVVDKLILSPTTGMGSSGYCMETCSLKMVQANLGTWASVDMIPILSVKVETSLLETESHTAAPGFRGILYHHGGICCV
jgi:hypothetical protein